MSHFFRFFAEVNSFFENIFLIKSVNIIPAKLVKIKSDLKKSIISKFLKTKTPQYHKWIETLKMRGRRGVNKVTCVFYNLQQRKIPPPPDCEIVYYSQALCSKFKFLNNKAKQLYW